MEIIHLFNNYYEKERIKGRNMLIYELLFYKI